MKQTLINQASQNVNMFGKKKAKQEESDEEEDLNAEEIDLQEELSKLYLSGKDGANEDQRVKEIMKKMDIADSEDLGAGETGNPEENDAESKAIEEIVKNRKDQVSDEFRLFESITKKNSRQILRYVFQADYSNIKHIVPLWYSHKNKVKQIPACELC